MNDNQDTRDEPNKLFIRLRSVKLPPWKERTEEGKDYAAASVMIDEHYNREEITTAIRNYYETMQPTASKEAIRKYAEERYQEALDYWTPPQKMKKHPVEYHCSDGTGGYL